MKNSASLHWNYLLIYRPHVEGFPIDVGTITRMSILKLFGQHDVGDRSRCSKIGSADLYRRLSLARVGKDRSQSSLLWL
jgi:hypothetical protein